MESLGQDGALLGEVISLEEFRCVLHTLGGQQHMERLAQRRLRLQVCAPSSKCHVKAAAFCVQIL